LISTETSSATGGWATCGSWSTRIRIRKSQSRVTLNSSVPRSFQSTLKDHYSSLSTTCGSSRDARHAGNQSDAAPNATAHTLDHVMSTQCHVNVPHNNGLILGNVTSATIEGLTPSTDYQMHLHRLVGQSAESTNWNYLMIRTAPLVLLCQIRRSISVANRFDHLFVRVLSVHVRYAASRCSMARRPPGCAGC
jgi:hypothetical protein